LQGPPKSQRKTVIARLGDGVLGLTSLYMTKMISDKLPDSQRCREFIRFRSACGASADQSQATQVNLRQVNPDRPGRMDIDQLWKVDFSRSAEVNFDQLPRMDFDSTHRVEFRPGS